MRHFIVLSLLIASFHADAQSKPAFRPEHSGFGTTGGNELQIRQLLDEQTTAWNRGDIESFMKGYWENDSLMFIGKGGVTYGWINTLNNYKKNYPDTAAMGKLSFNLITIKQLSPVYYYVVGKWHLQRSIGDVGGHFTLLFKKIKNRWVIIADHSS